LVQLEIIATDKGLDCSALRQSIDGWVHVTDRSFPKNLESRRRLRVIEKICSTPRLYLLFDVIR
jgi:hypothetical protein